MEGSDVSRLRDITHPREPRVAARHRETWVWIHWQGTCRDHCRTAPPTTVLAGNIPATAPRLTNGDGGSRRSALASASVSASAGAAVSARLASRRVASRHVDARALFTLPRLPRSLLASERAMP